MARKGFEESDNRTEVRYIRRHPKHDRFPVRRLGLAAALLIAVAAGYNLIDNNVGVIYNTVGYGARHGHILELMA